MKKVLLALTASAMMVAPAIADNGLTVNNTAAMGGSGTACGGSNCGLSLNLDGSTNLAFVEDQTPAAETIYRAEFMFDPNSLPMSAGDKFVILLTRRADFANSLRLQFNLNGGNYRVRLQVQKNNNEWADTRLNGNSGPRFVDLVDGPNTISIEARFGNSAESYAAVTVGAVTHYKDTYQSSSWSVDRVRMGGPRMNNATGGPFTGSVYFDEFASFRTLAP
ncbi:MAG: hypothetical protein K8J08_16425 [Thermoanaerobaculia bacterium]|nr:hypothetical protein [Thermoanaerobaculia bacterium]